MVTCVLGKVAMGVVKVIRVVLDVLAQAGKRIIKDKGQNMTKGLIFIIYLLK